MAKAKAKAEKVATAMGVKLLGVYDFSENTFDEERPVHFEKHVALMQSRAVAAPEPALEMDIQHSKTIQVNVEIWYRVSSF